MGAIVINEDVYIDESDIQLDFTRSSGPGGQNVNKVATAVQLRYDVANSETLPEGVRRRLKKLAGNRMTKEGVLILEASQARSQEQNRQDAIDRLVDLVRRAARKPKTRMRTHIPESQKRKRLEDKRRRSEKKALRRDPRLDDF